MRKATKLERLLIGMLLIKGFLKIEDLMILGISKRQADAWKKKFWRGKFPFNR
ncbi:hypothetical protein QWY77_06020 [Thalassotalea ponticola]|uniref:hypothetical protein n=1 Tax=Thalassotalea ponticola TaxID=1523392 RepID=UPI0025B347CE|nr:hypothetical protein [Thalassotalea ponticola]MDN3652316.1 hypothetical protein [Thalassotalea ponticola]